jgi:integrase
MPLKLKPPRAGRTPFWYVRGKYLGIRLDRSTQTSEERAAKVIFKRWKSEIERGEYRDAVPPPVATKPTFANAALAYIQAGGERAFLRPIIEMAGPEAIRDMLLTDIDQIALDRAAAALYPNATAPTRNRQFYTPVSAVLKRAGIDKRILRPKGWRGKKSVSWLEPEQAFALFAAADQRDREFGMFLRLLCYTGMRLGEALAIKLSQVSLERRAIYLPETKNGDARTVHLPPELVAALANHPRGLGRHPEDRLVRYHAGGRLRDLLRESMEAAGLRFPRRQGGFHLFCHTWATWMRRYGGLDTSALLETGRWKDRSSAARYEHLDTSEEAQKADQLPVPKRV